MRETWKDFKGGNWEHQVDVRDFIQRNYTPYEGNEDFLAGPTARTREVRGRLEELLKAEYENGGVLKADPRTVITPTAFGPGYLDKEKDIIVDMCVQQISILRVALPFGFGKDTLAAAVNAVGIGSHPPKGYSKRQI